MTRSERAGLGLAVIGHVALFAWLSLTWSNAVKPPILSKPIEVSLVDDVALDQHAPSAPTPPSQSAAPEVAPPEDAPPPPKVVAAAPDPAPPKPKADAVPPPKSVPTPKPAPKKPVAEKADKPEKAKAPSEKAASPPSKTVAATKAAGASPKASKAKATASLLDDDFRKGLTQSPTKTKASVAAPGVVMDGKAAADIGSAIQRQVQPCAARHSVSGTGVSRILVKIHLRINRDGTLAARPTIDEDHGGVDDENRIYVDAVDRAAITSFVECAPLKGLPPELYDVPRGWKTFILRYKLPG